MIGFMIQAVIVIIGSIVGALWYYIVTKHLRQSQNTLKCPIWALKVTDEHFIVNKLLKPSRGIRELYKGII